MKRLIFLLPLIGILSIPLEGFAKPSKQTTTTIKYKGGGKYVGEIKKVTYYGQKKKYRHGNGVMHYANGDSFDGNWNNDSPSYGTLQYVNGDCFKGSLKNNYLFGQLVFAHKGSVRFGFDDKLWEYPANSSFNGKLGGRRPLSGSFDCPLTSTTGDKFTGTIMSGNLDKGTILFANGDTFEGSFIQSAPSSGKYCYDNTTEIVGTTYKWIVPAGCTFNGDVQTFTGTVDLEVTNESGDRFIGSFIKGQPDEGTMTFADGTTETGKWHDGMSPSVYEAYLAKQEAERKRQEAEQKRQEAIKTRKSLEALEKRAQKHITEGIYPKTDLWPGAVLKLSQLFIGKKVSCDSQTYTCKNIRETDSGIEMLCIEKDGQSKILNFNKISFTSDPSDITKISTNYPRDLGRVFYYAYNTESYNHCYLISDQQNIPTYIKDYYIRKFGSVYGPAVMNKQVELGMTVNMVQAIYGAGEVTRHVESGREIIVLTYGGYNQFWGFFEKIRTYTFINNRLIEYSE